MSTTSRSPAQYATSPAETAPKRGLMLVMVPLMLVLFISNLDATVVATAIPTIGRDLGDVSGSSWIATAYLLTSAVTTLIFGKLGDMYGRKKIFQFSIVVFLVGSALSGAAGSMALLVLFRALQGIGGGGLNSLVMAITGDLIPARQRSKYQALVGIVATLALIAGPLLGGLFSDQLSWRWIFYLNIPIGVLALVAVATLLHLPRRTSSGRVDVAGGVLATVFTAAIMLFTTWGGTERPWGSPLILGLIALAVVSLIGYLLVERRAAEPITPLHLFRTGVFSISSAQFLIATMVLFVAMLYTPAFLQSVQHKTAFVAGLYVIPLLVGLVVATAVAGPVIARTGRYKIYPIIGAVLTGVSMFALTSADQHTATWALLVPLTFAGAGIGLFVQVALLAGQNAVDYKYLGVATGALNFFKSIGGAFGAALFGAILTGGLRDAVGEGASAHAFQTVFAWTVPFMVLSLVLGLVMKEKPLSDEMREIAEGKAEAPEY
ncbi:major facilitator superfamily MFS_1 [Catenulispora acidiphila DSM 44928]|uniref:Major facilitator superfamily MFS_1 n=1 Tax=Catenulispora acidiphila (strain DSM 44928 / JCM 14897 / NBRC 102108 / NRRL B-24433 / ID139908) TaxID=479433 RepID=C7Q7X7_CATAD|nr:MDR family MFS transporter [Catenulispora acidiphila]ACU74144.1 major facilitator superfamily MFS_1 [Catenulispora acidiphila DSM 44928]